MNQQFKCELDGTKLFKRALLFIVATVVSYIAFFAVYIGAIESENPFAILSTVVLYLLLIVSVFALNFQFIAELINSISLGDSPFTFNGTLGDYLKINIKGMLLTGVTCGIYGAWYTKNVMSFITGNTKQDGKDIDFMGNAPKLLKYFVLGLFLPLMAMAGIIAPLFLKIYKSDMEDISSIVTMIVIFLIYFVGLFIITAIITVLQYKWMVDIQFGEDDVSIDLDLSKAIGYVLGQLALIMITWGIYSFAAEVTIFRYFTNRVLLTNRSNGSVRKMKFNGDTGTGFGLIFGQTVLTMLTLGIYGPWAFANINNWMLSNVEIVEEAAETKDLYAD